MTRRWQKSCVATLRLLLRKTRVRAVARPKATEGRRAIAKSASSVSPRPSPPVSTIEKKALLRHFFYRAESSTRTRVLRSAQKLLHFGQLRRRLDQISAKCGFRVPLSPPIKKKPFGFFFIAKGGLEGATVVNDSPVAKELRSNSAPFAPQNASQSRRPTKGDRRATSDNEVGFERVAATESPCLHQKKPRLSTRFFHPSRRQAAWYVITRSARVCFRRKAHGITAQPCMDRLSAWCHTTLRVDDIQGLRP